VRRILFILQTGSMALINGMGCYDDAGLAKLQTGKAPTITPVQHVDEIASVDHLLPRSIVPELDNRLYNLRFMAESLNQAKGVDIDVDAVALAQRWYEDGLLSLDGLQAVEGTLQSH
jgi:hypothetical protein